MSTFEAISAAILSCETPVDVTCDCGYAPIGFIRPTALGEWEDSIREIIAHAQYSHGLVSLRRAGLPKPHSCPA